MDNLPFRGRCNQCDFALFTDLPVQGVDNFNGVKADGVPYSVGNGYAAYFARCPNNHKVFKLVQIKGTYSKDHKCDSRCLNARGHECTCSCGGMNHGRGFAVTLIEASAMQPVIITDDPSEKQINFIKRLLDERIIPDSDEGTGVQRRLNALKMIERDEITKKQASKIIEWLLTLPQYKDENPGLTNPADFSAYNH